MIWWLSFSGKNGFLGACIVRSDDAMSAIQVAWENKCNPGGEVLGYAIQEEEWASGENPYELNRLYSRAEIGEVDEAVDVDFEDVAQKGLKPVLFEEADDGVDPSLN